MVAMVTGEIVSDLVTPGEDKLRFEFDADENADEVVTKLRNTFECTVQDDVSGDLMNKILEEFKKFEIEFSDEIADKSSEKSDKVDYAVSASAAKNFVIMTSQCSEKEEEVDSDDEEDDFEPMMIPEENKFSKHKPPRYIRDFIEGINEKDIEVEKFELYLLTLNHLIVKSSQQINEICPQLCHLVLNLENKFDTDGFRQIRITALSDIIVADTKQAMEYLASQFYSENYTLDVRSDILSSVVIATGKLNPTTSIEKVDEVKEAPIEENNEDSVKNWRAVVDARIEQNTRRFSSKPKRAQQNKKEAASKFSSAHTSGWLFYPLIQKFDSVNIRTLDMLGRDRMLLTKLVHVVTCVCITSINLPQWSMMRVDMHKFLLFLLRRRDDHQLRSSALQCALRLLRVCHHEDIDESLVALVTAMCDVIKDDRVDTNLRRVAGHVVALIHNKTKESIMTSK